MRIPRKQKKALKKAHALRQRREDSIRAIQTLVMLRFAQAQILRIQSQRQEPAIKLLQMASLGIDTMRGLQNIYKYPILAL